MDITSFILALLQVQGEQTIVFTSSVVSTQRLCTLLNCFEGPVLRMIEYSSLQHQYSRSKALDAFRAGDVEVLVASDAIPVDVAKLDQDICKIVDNCFTRARLHVERLIFIESSYFSFEILNLENDPACFSSWKGQPIDSNQRKWFLRATHLGLFLETGSLDDLAQSKAHACGIVLNCMNLA